MSIDPHIKITGTSKHSTIYRVRAVKRVSLFSLFSIELHLKRCRSEVVSSLSIDVLKSPLPSNTFYTHGNTTTHCRKKHICFETINWNSNTDTFYRNYKLCCVIKEPQQNKSRPGGGSNPGSSVYETDALPLGHRADLQLHAVKM